MPEYPASGGGGGGGGTSVAPPGVAVTSLGLAMMTCLPVEITSNTSTSDGQIFACLVTAQKSAALSHLGIFQDTAGSVPGSHINGLALYSEAGALLASTPDMTSVFEGASSSFSEGTVSYTPTAGTNYYLALATSFSTAPHFYYQAENDTLPPLDGHYFYLYENANATSWPETITPSSMSTSFANFCMYAR